MFETSVEKRVCEIRKNSDVSKWLYCETKHSPTDLLTRPKNCENFQENLFWWTGAKFLKEKTIMHK